MSDTSSNRPPHVAATTAESAIPDAPQRDGRRERNPYATALLAIWIIALVVGILFIGRAASIDPPAGDSAEAIGYGALIVAAAVGLVHLGVKAVRWRDRP